MPSFFSLHMYPDLIFCNEMFGLGAFDKFHSLARIEDSRLGDALAIVST
jgi:hypothetical protein